MVFITQKLCIDTFIMLYVCVCMVHSTNVIRTVDNTENITSTWTNKSITSPHGIRQWQNPSRARMHKVKSGIHLHLQKKPIVKNEPTVYRNARKLLNESQSNYLEDDYVIPPTGLVSKVSFGYGLTNHGFKSTAPTQLVPLPSAMVDNSIAVMSVGVPTSVNAVDYKHALIGLSLDGVIVNDVFTFHFSPLPGNHTTLHRQKWRLTALAAANKLQETILKGGLFTPSVDPFPRLYPDIEILNTLCDSTETSLALCEWRNPIVDEQVSDDAPKSFLFYDAFSYVSDPSSTATTEANQWISENIIMPGILNEGVGSTSQDFLNKMLTQAADSTSKDFLKNAVTPTGKLMLFHPATSSFNSSTILDEDQNDNEQHDMDLVVLCVALVSKSE